MSASSEPPKLLNYQGNCHCGAFKFTLTSPELKQAFACNCSICSKNGYLWAFPASEEHFVIVKGDENSTLKTYEFGRRTMAHKFCPKCGTSVMARMHEAKNGQAIAVNIRALSDVDPLSLAVLTSDGAAIEPLYQAKKPPAAEAPAEEGTHVYEGSCHCGAVTYTLRQTDEPISLLTMCNCSICSRDAALWIYPTTSSLTFDGLDSLKEYTFATNKTFHGFCEICGVAIRERFEASPTTAINARTIHGLDLASSALEHFDGKSMLPLYEV